MSESNQVTLGLDQFQPAQQKTPEPTYLFDLSKDRLHELVLQGVGAASFDRAQFAGHALFDGCIARNPPSMGGRRRLAVSELLRGKVRLNAVHFTMDGIIFTLISRIGAHSLRLLLPGFLFEFFQNRLELLLVGGLLSDSGTHDHLGFLLHHRLVVVALLK